MKIFLSYRSVNRALVEELISDLEDFEHEVWYDQELEGGQKWWDNILENIRNCDLLIFAMTPQSLDSRPCQLEYTYANALKKPIIPIKLAGDISINLLPVVLQERHIIDYTQSDKSAFKALSAAIRRLPPTPPLPDVLPDSPTAPISPLANIKARIDEPALAYEEQAAMLHQLKTYLHSPEYAQDARALLERFKQHPMLLASVLLDIEELLAAPLPTPQAAPPPTQQPVEHPPSAETSATESTTEPQPITQPSDTSWLQEGEEFVQQRPVAFFPGYMMGTVWWPDKDLTITNQRLLLKPKDSVYGHPETIIIPFPDIQSLKKDTKMSVSVVHIHLHSGQDYWIQLVDLVAFGFPLKEGDRDEFMQLIDSLRQ